MIRPADLVDRRVAVAPALVTGQVCPKCGEDLAFSAFAMRSDGRRRQSWCRKCTLEAVSAGRSRRSEIEIQCEHMAGPAGQSARTI